MSEDCKAHLEFVKTALDRYYQDKAAWDIQYAKYLQDLEYWEKKLPRINSLLDMSKKIPQRGAERSFRDWWIWNYHRWRVDAPLESWSDQDVINVFNEQKWQPPTWGEVEAYLSSQLTPPDGCNASGWTDERFLHTVCWQQFGDGWKWSGQKQGWGCGVNTDKGMCMREPGKVIDDLNNLGYAAAKPQFRIPEPTRPVIQLACCVNKASLENSNLTSSQIIQKCDIQQDVTITQKPVSNAMHKDQSTDDMGTTDTTDTEDMTMYYIIALVALIMLLSSSSSVVSLALRF
jgi:hypothetical protein